jgi:ribosomal protein L37AE/L43A
MEDIYANDVVCKNCHKKTVKGHIVRDGFTIRTWECKGCNKVWHHPLDANEYLKFAKLRQKNFKVKLRKVGNSFAATIPQEIVEFGGIPKAGKTIEMHLEAANKVALMLK